jgi:hypothetical protein
VVLGSPPRRKKKNTWKSAIVEKPVTSKKRKNAKYLDKAKVYYNFVKVGFDTFDIYETSAGEEFVEIDGYTYWIERDSFGNGKLTTW